MSGVRVRVFARAPALAFSPSTDGLIISRDGDRKERQYLLSHYTALFVLRDTWVCFCTIIYIYDGFVDGVSGRAGPS